jgi:hypothetical protein
MNSGKTIFAQLMDFIPIYEFRKCVERYNGNFKVQSFSCWDQFLTMAFAQLTFRESLRDIEACLRMAPAKLYHMGFRSKISRNTLSNANQVRDWRIYSDFAQLLISIARSLYSDDDFGIHLKRTVYALDVTTIDLCLSLFPWARFRKHKAAVKLHTLLDLRGSIPTVIIITDGKTHEVNTLDLIIWEAGAIYLMDRGYLDFSRLYNIHQSGAFFITRAKKRFDYKRLLSLSADKTRGVKSDQAITLKNFYPKQKYPERLRRIHYFDPTTKKRLIFLTNNFRLSALTIADLYRCRWQVELFFRWIKQHLRIKTFYGTTENAVKTQIWTAISVYVLVAIVKKRLNLDRSLYSILQILSLSLLEKIPISQALSGIDDIENSDEACNQLNLFN